MHTSPADHRRPLRNLRHCTPTVLAGVLVTGLALTACGSSSGSGGDTSILSFAIGNDPLVLNPSAVGNGNDTLYVTRQLVDSLVYQNPDTLEIQPWLASSWTSNADATAFTFTLRDDVTFSDGSALDADTVKANFDDIKAAGAEASGVATLQNYSGAEVKDARTVTLTFSGPNAAFLSQISTPNFGIVSTESLKVPFAERAGGKNVAGSGPFVLDNYTKNDSVTLKKRDGYAWAPPGFDPGADGAQTDTVKFTIVPESGNRTGGLTSGQVDVAGGIAPNDIDAVSGSSEIVKRANPGTVFGLYLNTRGELFADAAVRRAISEAINPTEIRDGALNDNFAIADSPLASTTSGHKDVSAGFDVNRPDNAARLLDDAGWKKGADGIREKDGKKLTLRITYINNFGPNPDSIALIQQQFEKIGIGSTQQSGTVPEFQNSLTSGDYDIAWRNLSGADGDILRTDFGDTRSTRNWPIPDKEIQDLLAKQLGTSDQAARDELLGTLQEKITESRWFVPVHELTTVVGVSKKVSGVSLGADSRLNVLVDASKK